MPQTALKVRAPLEQAFDDQHFAAAEPKAARPALSVPRSRGRRVSSRLKTFAAACAMGSWALLVVIPVLVILSWLTDLHLS